MSKRSSHSSKKIFQAEQLECRRLMATISGSTVWDTNNDNVAGGFEPNVAGVTVFVDYANNGTRDPFEPMAVSNSSGNFTINSVNTGTWNLREIAPTNYFSTNVLSVTVPSSGSTLIGKDMFNVATLYKGESFFFSHNDQASLRRSAAGTQYEIGAAGGPYTVPLNIPSLRFELDDGDDTLTVDYANGNPIPAGGVSYDGGTHTTADTLVISGTASAETFNLGNGTATGGAGNVSYTNVQSVVVNSLAGADTIDINALGGGVNLQVNAGISNDSIYVGSGNLDNIAGAVSVNGQTGSDTIVVDDTALPFDDGYTITSTTLTRSFFGGLTYGTSESLIVDGENGSNNYYIYSTAASTPLTVSDNAGDNAILVGAGDLGTVQGAVEASGTGFNAVVLDDSAVSSAQTYTIESSSVARGGFGGVAYSGANSLVVYGSQGNDTYNVNSTFFSTPLTIYAGAGGSTLNVGAGDIQYVKAITFNGGAGYDAININDSLSASSDTYSLTDTTIARAFFGGLTYYGADAINFYGATGVNTYNIDSTATFVPVYLFDSSGPDSINVMQTSYGGGVFLFLGSGDDEVNVNSNGFVVFPNQQRIGKLTITDGYAQLFGGVGSVLTTTRISTIGTGKLDLTDGAVILDYTNAKSSPLDSIQQSLTSGYASGAWNGNGIISSTAQFTPGTAVGFADATDLFGSFPATFAGQSIGNKSILMRYTLNGDANLNKTVDTVDFSILAANFSGTGKRWSKGDFNYNTTTETVYFNLLARKFSQSLAAPSAKSVQLPVPAAAPGTLFSSTQIPDVDLELLV